LVEAVARRRGFLLKGGGIDLEKAALTLLQDYRDGALGRISLETPETRAAMLREAEERATALAVAAAAEQSADPAV
jgi:ribosome biogenesis GTPase A